MTTSQQGHRGRISIPGSNGSQRSTDAQLVSELGRRALTETDIEVVYEDVLDLVVRRLDVELAKILELVPSGEGFLLVAGVGWQPGYVGQVVVPLVPESQAGYTMQTGEVVVVDDLRTETRFRGMPLLHEHGVVSGISTVLRGRDKAHGIMTAHCTHRRPFTEEDVAFFDAVAGVLGAAMDRRDMERALFEAHQRLKLAMDAGRLGAWEWNPHTGEVVWSEQVEKTYGLGKGEFPGTVDAYVEFIHPDDRGWVWAEIQEALVSGRLEMQYRIIRPDGAVRWLNARGMVVHDIRGQPARMSGVCSDETEAKLEEMCTAAQYAVTRVLAESATVPEAMSGILQAVCSELDWPVGQMWLLDRETDQLRFSDRCISVGLESADFEEVSASITFNRGVGLPGRVLASGRPVWIPDLSKDKNFPRLQAAAKSGLKSGFAFPITLGHEVIGVMEFFALEQRHEHGGLLEAMASIGSQIGQFVERKHVEEQRQALMFELKAAETRYRGVFEQVSDAILATDAGGHYVEANAAASTLLGYSHEELLRMKVGDIVAGGDVWGEAEFANSLRDGKWSGELELRRKDGTTATVEARAATINLPTGDVYVSVLRDVTQRRALENSRAFLAQASAILSASLDYDETLSSLARLCVPFLGDWCSVEMIEDGQLRRVAVVHSDPEKVRWAEEFRMKHPPEFNPESYPTRLLMEGKSYLLPEVTEEMIRASARDPGSADVIIQLGLKSAIVAPIHARGRTLGLLVLATAESSRRYTEVDQALVEDLGRRAGLAVDNARLYMESRKAQDELLKANASKDEFLGLISHEMRTPMTTIHGGARLLRRRWDRIDEKSRDEVLNDIEQQAERLQRIVEDLLVLARVELGEVIETEPVLVQRLVDQTITAYSKRRPNRRIELYEDPDTLPVNGSQIYLEQVLLNLVNNADKYSPVDQPIEVHTEMRGDQVVISVLDRGPGIPAEEMDRIFERFFRSPGTAGRASGAGIGLTVCKRLIEAQNGTIWAEPRDGGGLVVSFSLPAYEERS
jgi:PAS domain S-box-containing protein